VSFRNWQYIAYYDGNGYVVLGKRKHEEINGSCSQHIYKVTFRMRTM